ncbi:MAG: hypothetical protein ACXWP6_05240 [Ktedonobacterales bacterium]
MFCPTCQTVMRVNGARCPTCGDGIHPIQTTDVVEVVESSAAYAEGEVPNANGDAAIAITEAVDSTLVPSGKKQLSLLARLPELSVLAWQQPTVRSAVKTGAGAIMLSLAMRAARQWLSAPRNRRAVTDSLGSALGELLRPAEGEQRPWPGNGVEVTETLIYVRRYVRRTSRR